MSAHKLYGPKGIGALYVRRAVVSRLRPLIDGGGDERRLRSGTLNVAGAVGFGEAAALAAAEMGQEAPRLRGLGELLRTGITSAVPGCTLVGHPSERIPGNVTLAFAGVDAAQVMLSMPDIAASNGSASAPPRRRPPTCFSPSAWTMSPPSRCCGSAREGSLPPGMSSGPPPGWPRPSPYSALMTRHRSRPKASAGDQRRRAGARGDRGLRPPTRPSTLAMGGCARPSRCLPTGPTSSADPTPPCRWG